MSSSPITLGPHSRLLTPGPWPPRSSAEQRGTTDGSRQLLTVATGGRPRTRVRLVRTGRAGTTGVSQRPPRTLTASRSARCPRTLTIDVRWRPAALSDPILACRVGILSSPFVGQLAAYERVLAKSQSPDDGGWPHWLDLATPSTSIVATAHAVELLRYLGRRYDSPPVQMALQYLAAAASEHAQEVDEGGRGSSARYPAYSLWGLSRFEAARHDPALANEIKFALSWLAGNKLRGGGWGPRAGSDEPLSYVVTMPAVSALDRFTYHPDLGGPSRALAAGARAAVARSASSRGTSTQRYWGQPDQPDTPHSGLTALAVLTLADGSADDQRMARAGITWLMSHVSEWAESAHLDEQITDCHWWILSYSLGIRAVLHPVGDVSPADHRLRAAFKTLGGLWMEEFSAWSHTPGPRARPSTTGSFAVITAVRAIKRSRLSDPFAPMPNIKWRRASALHPRAPTADYYTMSIHREDHSVRVADAIHGVVLECNIVGDKRWPLLLALAERHHANAGTRDQRAQTMTERELAVSLGVEPDSVRTSVTRLNRYLSERAVGFLPGLVERITPSDGLEPAYGFDEVSIEFTVE